MEKKNSSPDSRIASRESKKVGGPHSWQEMGRALWRPQQIAPKKGRNEQGISSSANIPPTCVKHQSSFEHLKRISDDLTIKISGLETFKLSVCALCIHSLWHVSMQSIKVFWQLETIFHSFQLIHSESPRRLFSINCLTRWESQFEGSWRDATFFEVLAFWIIAPYCSKCYFWWNDTLNTRYSVLRAYLLPFQIFGILQT